MRISTTYRLPNGTDVENWWDNTPNDVLRQVVGARIVSVVYEDTGTACLTVETDRGTLYMWHEEACCESVYLDDGLDDLRGLVGQVITLAEARDSGDCPAKVLYGYADESFTWTFYEIQTADDSATLRWYGTSNGYYSESVDVSWDGE